MKSVRKYYSFIIILTLFLSLFLQQKETPAQNVISAEDKKIVADFEHRANDYAKLRQRLEKKLPKLPKDATAEQIDVHKAAFQKLVQSARSAARQGDLFTPSTIKFIRNVIRKELKPKDISEICETVLEADTKGVPLKINYPYP